MYEVEVKIPTAHGPVRERLVDLGAESLGAVRQRDTYYDHPTREFAETDEALRLRLESGEADGPTATLAYKGPLVDDVSKTREEVETGVTDPEAMDTVLRAVGFEPAAEVEKGRERYRLDGYAVALDDVAGIGEFVEVEGEGEESELDALREGAFALCRDLGLDPVDAVRTSYLSMLVGED